MKRIEFQLYNNNIKLNIVTHNIREPPSAILIHIHGFLSSFTQEKREFYLFENRLELLKDLKILSYGLELRGHGSSENINLCKTTFDDYSSDLHTLIKYIKKKHPNVNIHILTSSMGGTVALNYCIKKQKNIKSIILSCPLIKLSPFIRRIFSNVNESNIHLYLPYVKPILSIIDERYKNILNKYDEKDLLLLLKNLNNLKYIHKNNYKITIPIMIFHGDLDPVTDSISSNKYIKKCLSNDKKIIIYKNCINHEVLKDVKILPDIKQNIYDWMKNHI